MAWHRVTGSATITCLLHTNKKEKKSQRFHAAQQHSLRLFVILPLCCCHFVVCRHCILALARLALNVLLLNAMTRNSFMRLLHRPKPHTHHLLS